MKEAGPSDNKQEDEEPIYFCKKHEASTMFTINVVARERGDAERL